MSTQRTKPPLLSIVTINKNNDISLQRTLNSLGQTRGLDEVECLFIDGFSSDRSMEIAEDFYAPNEMISEPDSGIYNAMNKGLSRSRGKYVLWINSGDQLAPGLQRLLPHFRLEYSLIAFGVEIAREGPEEDNVIKACTPSLARMPDGMIVHQGMALHRKTLLDLGGYDEQWHFTSDFDVLVRLHLSGQPMLCLPNIISRFYLGGHTSDLIRVSRERLEILRANGAISRHRYWYRLMRNRMDLASKVVRETWVKVLAQGSSP